MLKGFPDFDVNIKIEKTVTNLECEGDELIKSITISDNPVIKYFGYELDTDKGFIFPNMEKYNGINIKSTLNFKSLNTRYVPCVNKYFQFIKDILKYLVQSRY